MATHRPCHQQEHRRYVGQCEQWVHGPRQHEQADEHEEAGEGPSGDGAVTVGRASLRRHNDDLCVRGLLKRRYGRFDRGGETLVGMDHGASRTVMSRMALCLTNPTFSYTRTAEGFPSFTCKVTSG
jgi:hypothetical protein